MANLKSYISLKGDDFLLSIPQPEGSVHTVKIEASLRGLDVLRTVLESQRLAGKQIGEAGAPVQYDIDALIRASKVPVTQVDASASALKPKKAPDRLDALAMSLDISSLEESL